LGAFRVLAWDAIEGLGEAVYKAIEIARKTSTCVIDVSEVAYALSAHRCTSNTLDAEWIGAWHTVISAC
jgi:hypothetical protein